MTALSRYYRLAYETIHSNHPSETSAEISTFRLRRVAETNQTFISYETEFASDVSRELIQFTNKGLLSTLQVGTVVCGALTRELTASQELRSGLLASKPSAAPSTAANSPSVRTKARRLRP